MKILFTGYHNPHFVNTNVYKEEAIKELGHELISFEDRDFFIPGRIRRKFHFLQLWDIKRLNGKLVALAEREKPSLCIVSGGHRILPETVAEIKRKGITIVLWTTDVPVDFTNIKKAAPFYDHIFCSGTEAVEIFRDQGLGKVYWLPFACDPRCHSPVELSEKDKKKYANKVVFVGSFYPERANVLESVSDLDIAVWGPYWKRLEENSPLKRKVKDAKLNYDEWVKIYNTAEIVLVIHYNTGGVPCNQASPKLYEALACGKFVLADNQKDARALFEDGRHMVFFEDEGDLRKKIDYYLGHPEERERIAAEGRKEVLKEHTYKNRIKKILEIMNQD